MGAIKNFYHDQIERASREPHISDDEYFYDLHLEDQKNCELWKQENKLRKQINLNKWKKKI